jgi:stage II sporulation protein D
VRIRLLTDFKPEYLLFSVTSGKYVIENGADTIFKVPTGENVIIARYDGRIVVKIRGVKGLIVDSLLFKGVTGEDNFSIRINNDEPERRNYTGDLQCYPDFGTLLLINSCDIETYVQGVVKSEGGNGKNEEYFRTQAVIARTYTYKYFNKHIIDRYNLCDGTHCQAFNGVIQDSVISAAVVHTKDLVITTPDSNLIISAFHSNCGGETSPSEYVWLTSQSYLTKVIDPYCLDSRNATWEKMISLTEWNDWLSKNGYPGETQDASIYNFKQPSRVPDYVADSLRIPLRIIRTGLGLRSSFFSVSAEGDSLRLSGRGYGHGVGLCQEGAMAMALKGFTFEKIISFYYPGVLIMDVKNAVLLPQNPAPKSPEGGLKAAGYNPPSGGNGGQKEVLNKEDLPDNRLR